MNESARVRFIGALEELRGGLQQFADDGTNALDAAGAEVRRCEQWLEAQLQHWETEIRRWEEEVFIAKEELARQRMRKVGDRPVDCWEQEKALRLAKNRLRHAEEKQDITRHWLRQWDTELMDYQSPSRQLRTMLEGDVTRACALLERKVEMLEAYMAVSPPEDGSPRNISSSPQAPAETKEE